MEPERTNFGGKTSFQIWSFFNHVTVEVNVVVVGYISAGPRELCGAVDLISQYKLLQYHDFFCKRSLSASLSDSHYLHDVVGDTEIRKGDGMQLDQLIQNNTSQSRESNNTRIQPFDMDKLKEAFQLNDMTPVELPPVSICSLSLGAFKFFSPYENRYLQLHKLGNGVSNDCVL